MKNNYLEYCPFLIVLFVALIVFNILGGSIFYSFFNPFNGEPLGFVNLLIKFVLSNLSVLSFIADLPFVAIALLFTMQYHHVKLDIKNIIYIGVVSLICVLVTCCFKLWGIYYLYDYIHNIVPLGSSLTLFLGWDFFCYILAILLIGVASHFYFRNDKVNTLKPLSQKTIIILVLICQVILVNYICIFSTVSSITESIRYTADSKIIESIVYLVVFLINFAILFICFYAWNYSYLIKCESLDNYALKTTLSFVVMNLIMLVFCVVFSLILALFMSNAKNAGIIPIVAMSYFIACVVFIFIISQSKLIAYLILCCLAYFAPLVILFFLDIPYTFFVYSAYVGLLSVSLFAWCISNKLSMSLVFK